LKNKLLSIFSLFLLASLTATIFYYREFKRLGCEKKELTRLKSEKIVLEDKEKEHALFLKKFSQIEENFLEKHLQTLTLLEKEKLALDELFTQPSWRSYLPLKERALFLEANQILLVKSEEHQFSKYVERHYKLSKPVEVCMSDVQKILDVIEKEKIDAPQLQIKKWVLEKKQEGLYSLDMEIIERIGHG